MQGLCRCGSCRMERHAYCPQSPLPCYQIVPDLAMTVKMCLLLAMQTMLKPPLGPQLLLMWHTRLWSRVTISGMFRNELRLNRSSLLSCKRYVDLGGGGHHLREEGHTLWAREWGRRLQSLGVARSGPTAENKARGAGTEKAGMGGTAGIGASRADHRPGEGKANGQVRGWPGGSAGQGRVNSNGRRTSGKHRPGRGTTAVSTASANTKRRNSSP